MTSELKSATAKANGSKSRGPKTPETRQKSSRNSITHGFTSKKTVVLDCESPELFQEMLGYYVDTYQPGSPVEGDLVAEMVAARWRMQRLRMIETALLDSEMNREPSIAEAEAQTQTEREDPGYQLALAFRRLVDDSRAISLASRYESRLHRIHERSHRTLRELQQTRKEQNAQSTLPSPSPILPEQPATEPFQGPGTSVGEATPSASKPEPQAPPDNEKSQNEPTAVAVPPAVPSTHPTGDDRPRPLFIGHRGLRRIDTKGFRYSGLLKTA